MTPPPPPSRTSPVIIGRERELTLIIDRLRQQAPGVILVTGEAGIGKTRLVNAVAREALQVGYVIARGHCYEADANLPYAPLRDLLQAFIADHQPAELAGIAGPYAPSLARLLPELDVARDEKTVLVQDKRDLFEAFDRVLVALAKSSPLAVILEDLHWSDSASLEVLLFLARRSTTRPLALILTLRDDEADPDLAHMLAQMDRDRLALEIPLRGLHANEIDAMLRATLGLHRSAPADLIHLLLTLTEGNPFFIEEVLTSIAADGIAASADGHWTMLDADRLHVPRSVQDAVRRRSRGLSATAKRVLQLAAVAGARFDIGLIGEMANLDEAALLDAVRELITAGLLTEDSADRLAFRHALTRQAVYAELLARERRRLHAEMIALLERSMAEDDTRLADLAYHASAALDWVRAREYSRRAGERAMALHAPRAAVAQFTRAMETTRQIGRPPDTALARALGAAHEMLGEFESALAMYQTAREQARATGDLVAEAEALLSLGLLWSGRDYGRAGEAIRNALEVARQIGEDALVARCLNRLGNWHLNTLNTEESQACHREALAIMERLGDRRGVAETLDLMGISALISGDIHDGITNAMRAVPAWNEIGDRRGLASSLILLGMQGPTLHTDTVPAVAPLADSLAPVDEALAIAREIGWRAGESWALWLSGGLVMGAQGAYRTAFERLHTALAIAEEIEHVQWTAAIHCMLGKIHTDLFAFPQARQHLDHALGLASTLHSPYWVQSAAGWLASALVAEGGLDAAHAAIQDGEEVTSSLTSVAGRLVWSAKVELALAQGDPERALNMVEHMLTTTSDAPTRRPIARLELLRGKALMALEATEASEIALTTARDVASELDARPVLWRAHLALANLFTTSSRATESAEAAEAAREVVEALATEVPSDALRQTFLAATESMLPGLKRRQAGLTAREIEIARLLVRGMTNREIADVLYITEWTAATHVRNILAKLDMTSRTQIAAWAVQHGVADRS